MRKTGLAFFVALGMVGLAGGSAWADSCGELRSRLAQLEAADRAQWSAPGVGKDPYAIEREKRGVLKALAANRCSNAEVRRETRAGRLLSGIFSKRPFRSDRYRDGAPGEGFPGAGLGGGPYRTLCVRTCDGYYFPISFSAAGTDLKRDEVACRALCPGQDVALYVQSSGRDGGPSVSLAGESYAALPTAFRYRSEYDRACTCGPIDATVAAAFQAFSVPPPDTSIITGAIEGPSPAMPRPGPRPLADDPETLANRAGRLVPGRVAPAIADSAVYARGPDGRLVRLVGDEAGYLSQ
jgi:hypothetical protein